MSSNIGESRAPATRVDDVAEGYINSAAGLSGFLGMWLPKLEAEMRDVLHFGDPQSSDRDLPTHYGMMHYHMGWADEHFAPQKLPSGKRLRPMLCLLTCAEVGGNAENALPAAAAIEILHNFSLVHDDIEDGDSTRRHRPTMWKVWGVPQAINAGDAMYTLAYVAMSRLASRGLPAVTTLAALDIFMRSCIELTEGQHLDMRFEQESGVTVDEYMRMIGGKTASLVGCATTIGAKIGRATSQQQDALGRFGRAIGLAFQIQDDILGIWGDPSVTGKAAGNDILRRKKSLPLLYALHHDKVGEALQHLWSQQLTEEKLPQVMEILERAGTREFAEAKLLEQHEIGIAALREALGERAPRSGLWTLTQSLLNREK